VRSSLPLGEALFATQVLVKLTLASEFEDQEDALAVVEVAEKAEDVGMGKIGLNLDLSADLFLDLSLLKLDLV
jgi:hypothetical protein